MLESIGKEVICLMPNVELNYGAVLVAAVINMILGAFWYSPILFAKPWMKLIGKKEEDLKKGNMPLLYGSSFASYLIMSYVLAHVIYYSQATTFLEGMVTGFWMWLGFVVTTSGVNSLFEGKHMQLTAINLGYPLVGLMLMGAVLAVWK